MPIDFHARQNRYTYSGRDVDPGWMDAMQVLVEPVGKRIADVGCGGGLYSLAWHALGAAHVTGVDFSAEMVAASRERGAGVDDVCFVQGSAAATGLPTASCDVVFQRALIHHLPDYVACFAEARRLLAPGGRLLVQDRTPEDVDLPGSSTHLRGYFFDCFPRLRAVEAGRRPTHATVAAAMQAAGFTDIAERSLWETRKRYDGVESLALDLAARSGRSILHELSDDELQSLIDDLRSRLPADEEIVEQDRWTLWVARPA
ncbi:class I SAM-dependent methyltransferase [Xanthomonas rydalmerensis]|uniref:Class I SAM-dependent methyltransferase n=1 Tax=Xanthomonas rydalmerensis TaxID=3046274 RepID=A0ABZ0JSE8_9XANT|nr:class I SAM-dependent methyltransferase [Xanthomonas sp. DM-2023]WOS42754.1 class I SAM-dependent methyltransferase [Xanthomonas sp. DM-2023]WOS46940.1 class I SAM-dependent methyltransferase [Xanthomonas sp. DM-2023]WOS51119.1 class I SAM-dependent methyltransferase [Xanthomonas sp. DM-2023]WOS55300.1 class I SAM-dependent methyltransferase [Xanthomonas sp. DM-2023]WOS59482.1 class I SAM-dependent methyltransferase [Xanthomonas sp. DM-2023]